MHRARSLPLSAHRPGSERLSVRAAMAVIGAMSLTFWAALIGLAVYFTNG